MFRITCPLREEPVITQRNSNVVILVICCYYHGWVDGIGDIGSFGTVDFSKCKPDCHMRPQYIWNNDQQSRIMAVLFDDLNRFVISVRDKLYETFTVYIVMAFTRWPRVAVKSTLLWLRTFFPCFPMIPSVACEWRLPAATEWGRVCRNFTINLGFTSEFSRTHGTIPPINFRVELKACFCRIKWLTSISDTIEITFIWRENRHLLLLVHGHRRRGQFSHIRWVWRFWRIWLAYRYYA